MHNQLICGDALEVLSAAQSDSVDIGITSPPYNKQGKNRGWIAQEVTYDGYADCRSENDYQSEQVKVLNQLYRVVKPGGSFFYNHKVRWERGEMSHPMDWLRQTLWTVRQEIIWDRILAANIRGWRFWQVEERIYWLYKPVGNHRIGKELASSDAKLTSIWRGLPESNNNHPAPFPLWIPARIILSLLNVEEKHTVIDPYIGSGTTAVAATLLGQQYIGIDSSEKYLEEAKERIENFNRERAKIVDEMALHTLKSDLKGRKEQGAYLGKYSPNQTAQEKLF